MNSVRRLPALGAAFVALTASASLVPAAHAGNLSCLDAPYIKPKATPTPASQMTFVVGRKSVQVFLQTMDTNRRFYTYKTLKAGDRVTVQTSLGHPWVVAGMSEAGVGCHEAFMPTKGASTYLIGIHPG